MMNKREENELEKVLPESAVPKLSKQEAEEKVAEMFALAAANRKRPKKLGRSSVSEVQSLFESYESGFDSQATDENTEESLLITEQVKENEERESTDRVLSYSELTERKFSPEEAEEEIAKLFAYESSKHPKVKSKGPTLTGAGLEITILEFISFFLFMFSMRSGTPGTFSLFAILLPVIVGIGYRVIRQHFTLLDAVSACKPHIFISSCFYICVILSV